MANADPATAPPDETRKRVRDPRPFTQRHRGLISTLDFFLRKEGTGAVFAILIFLGWIFALNPGVDLCIFCGFIVALYANAQRDGVESASKDQKIGDDLQGSKDSFYSMLPAFVIGFIIFSMLTFGLGLKYYFHFFQGEDGTEKNVWLEHILFPSGRYLLWLFIAWIVVEGDLAKNSEVYNRLTRRGGLRQRLEEDVRQR
jgi:hypothetical protein